MNPCPKISVLMSVFNGEDYLASAVESILVQTFTDFEFIIVDDGSSDRSLSILQPFAKRDARIKIISRPNTGLVGALNDGLAAAHGEYIARMDADDRSAPERLERQLAWMEKNPDCVLLGSACLFTDPEGRPLKAYRPHPDHAAIEDDLAGGNGGAIIHASGLFRREALIQCGGYRQRYKHIEDLDLFVRLLDVGHLANLPDILYYYRQHPLSINHVQGSRAVQAAEIVKALRERKGLPPTTPEIIDKYAAQVDRLDRCRRKWALDAAEGDHYDSAWANALLAVRHGPLDRANWSTLRYIYSLRKTAKKS